MTFVKGQSGNPNGRPRVNPELKAMCRARTKEAVERLITEMKDGDTSGARITAANAILDRGWGKPAQPQTGEGGEGPVELSVSWQPSAS